MKTVIAVDNFACLPAVRMCPSDGGPAVVAVGDDRLLAPARELVAGDVRLARDLARQSFWRSLDLATGDRVVLGLGDPDTVVRCLDFLADEPAGLLVTVVTIELSGLQERYPFVYFLSITALLEDRYATVLRRCENRARVTRLLDISRSADKVLILLQNDPDPDALASGLALRVLMGRNKQTAPLATLGAVTRSENLNMLRCLDLEVTQVQPADVNQYGCMAMVDVQPPYFKGLDLRADIVVDHHPCADSYDSGYADIRVAYGSTSTILTEYLVHENYRISQRLATALLYGIKTDTMFLERDISRADIHAFTYLYPMANLNMIRQIEHPNLACDEIEAFITALKNITTRRAMLCTGIGTVEKEDIVPRLADFCMQIGAAEWAVVWAVAAGNLVCCVRNVGYVKHAGDLVSRVFGTMGSAGGHRSMAKAVVPLGEFKRRTGLRRRGDFTAWILDAFTGELE